ncbi:hypothetical protein HYX08_02965 [Candidatus Woesearchaeota archaeon]|nr:hypothetical protein [Candidatus Woesearchaeota archaeon]
MSVAYYVVKSIYRTKTPDYLGKIKAIAKSHGEHGIFLLFSGNGAYIVDIRSMNAVKTFNGKNLKKILPSVIKEYEWHAAKRRSKRVVVVPDFMYDKIVELMKGLPDLYIHGTPLDITINALDYTPPTKPKLKSFAEPKPAKNGNNPITSIDGLVADTAAAKNAGIAQKTFGELIREASKPTDAAASFEKILRTRL